MNKTILTAAIALALTTGISAPAQAGNGKHAQWVELQSVSQSTAQSEIDKFAANPVRYLVALLLPAVQA